MKLRRLLQILLALAGAATLSAQNAEPVPTTIEAQSAEMITVGNLTTIVYEGKVRVKGTNLSLACDYLKIELTNAGAAGSTIGKLDKFRSLLATGNVIIVQGEREAACGRAVILPDEDKIVLSDSPVVVDHGSQTLTEAEEFTMHRGERKVTAKNIRSVGPALKDLGFDKDKLLKPAQPAETPKSN